MIRASAIIPAAGYGLRLNKKIPKALIEINHKPIFIHTLNTISQHPGIGEIILVAPSRYIKIFKDKIKQFHIKKIQNIIPGGFTRRESVENGLKFLKPEIHWVLIHDAVRPFLEHRLITKVINEAKRYGAAVVGLPVKATIKKVLSPQCPSVHSRFTVEKTLDRNNLWEIQTPQVFKKELILKAYNKFKDKSFTDDSSLVERLGVRVRLVKGSYFNIKITTPEDLILAGTILSKRRG